MELTEAQEALATLPGSRYVEACPGAGKTRAIAARYVNRATAEPRRGVALLSFTNAAVEEVAARCAGQSTLLDAPHFVGTFDSFINRYVTTPMYVRSHGLQPRYIESWDAVPGTKVTVHGMTHGVYYPLEWFKPLPNTGLELQLDRVRGKFANSLNLHFPQNQEAVCDRARSLFRRYVLERGIVSSSASRFIASVVLASPERAALIGPILNHRFAEVIVDEAQDCGEEELAILRFLRAQEIDVVAVADIDQSIYEFRRAIPDEVRQFAAELPQGDRLDGNFRSTPAICALNGSLRFGDQADDPCGDNAKVEWPVAVVPFDEMTEVAPRFQEWLEELDATPSSIRVLAHRTADARNCAGDPSESSEGAKKVLRLARASIALTSPESNSRARRDAITAAERVLVDLVLLDDVDQHSTESAAAELALDERWLRASAMRLCCALDPRSTERVAYAAGIRQIVGKLPWPAGVELRNLSQHVMAATAEEWEGIQDQAPAVAMPWGTIHSAKGHEFDAVAVVLPGSLMADEQQRTLVDLWENGLDGESRRVIYVGASRAERLLALAVHQDHVDRVCALLDRDEVPFDRRPAD